MSICPNKNLPEWNNLVNEIGEFEAYRVFIENGNTVPSDPGYIKERRSTVYNNDPNFTEKLDRLSRSIKADVVLDKSIENHQLDGQNAGERPVIRINPDKIMDDTVIHEFGHIYIDLLGGMTNPLIQRGVEQLENSSLYAEVAENYPELNAEQLQKEVLATAIGREGAEIFTNESDISSFNEWLNFIFDRIKQLLGIDRNIAQSLARDLLDNRINEVTLSGEISPYAQQQRIKTDELKNSLNKTHNDIKRLNGIYRRTGNKEYLQHLEEAVNQIAEKERVEEVAGYANYALQQLEHVADRIDKASREEITYNAYNLRRDHQYMKAYQSIPDVINGIREELKNLSEPESREIAEQTLKALKEAESIRQDIFSDYIKHARELQARRLAEDSTVIEAQYRVKFEKEFQNKNPIGFFGSYTYNDKPVSKSEYTARRNAYVNEKLAEYREQIQQESVDYFKEMLKTMPNDIGYLDSWVEDPTSLSSPILQSFSKNLLDVHQDIMNEFRDEHKEFFDIVQAYEEQYGRPFDQRSKYDGLIEKDSEGNETTYLVSEYKSEFLDRVQELQDELNQEGLSQQDKDNIQQRWRDKHLNANKSAPHERYKNPQYQELQKLPDSDPKRQLYDKLIELSNKADENINMYHLQRDKYNALFYKMPAIHKDFMNRITETGFTTFFAEGFRDLTQKRVDTTEEGHTAMEETETGDESYTRVLEDEEGRVKKLVPVHYRSTLEPNQQSFDLASIYMSNLHMSINHKEKSKLVADAEMLKDLMEHESTKYWSHQKGKKALGLVEDDKQLEPAEQSNTYKVLQSLIDHHIYGESMIDKGEILGYNKNQLGRSVMQWTGDTMLMLNFLAGGANLIHGRVLNYASAWGGDHFTVKEYRKAGREYWKDIQNIISDIGARRKTSKVNLLAERFNTYGEHTGLPEQMYRDTKFQQYVQKNRGHFMNQSGEHFNHGQIMYAVLENNKIQNENGEYIDTDGNVVTDRDAAMSLLDAYYADDSGYIQLNEHAKRVENYPRFDLTDPNQRSKMEKRVQGVIKDINADNHGQYDPVRLAMSQRHIGFAMVWMLRKWMVRGIKKRYRGGFKKISKAWKGKDEFGDMSDTFYSEDLGDFKEGNYVTSLRFMGQLWHQKNELSTQLLSQKWNEMSDMERANIRKSVIEWGFIMTAWIASHLIRNIAEEADDDESRRRGYLAAFYARRAYSELTFYTTPPEFARVLRNPAAGVSMMEDLWNLGERTAPLPFTSPTFERYEQGAREGELKIAKDIGDVIPIMNQLRRYEHIDESMNYIFSTGAGR